MKAQPLKISGSWKIEFQKFEDNRGFFYESFKAEEFPKLIGVCLHVRANQEVKSQ